MVLSLFFLASSRTSSVGSPQLHRRRLHRSSPFASDSSVRLSSLATRLRELFKESNAIVTRRFASLYAESHSGSIRKCKPFHSLIAPPLSFTRPLDENSPFSLSIDAHSADPFSQQYVIQWVVEKGDPVDRNLVISKISGQLLALAQQKFASNVIEKCIIFASDEERRNLVQEVLEPALDGSSKIKTMLIHPFANYGQSCILTPLVLLLSLSGDSADSNVSFAVMQSKLIRSLCSRNLANRHADATFCFRDPHHCVRDSTGCSLRRDRYSTQHS